MVKAIRDVKCALGDGMKKPNEAENLIKLVARKSITAKQDIKTDSILSSDMLIMKRPGYGISPKYLGAIIGEKVNTNISKDEQIKWEKIK